MARDSQLAGDRVQTEYYLQFADHYFRVLSESRARFEDQNPRRQRDDELDEDGDEDFLDASENESQGGDDRPEREDRPDRGARSERHEGQGREPRRFNRNDRPAGERAEPESRPRLNGNDDSLPLDVLPPAIGADAGEDFGSDEAPASTPRPRRRARNPRPADGESDIAPAA